MWNIPSYGNGYVVKFEVEVEYMKDYTVQNVGGIVHNEYWITLDELEEFNKHIVGAIQVIE